MNDAGVFTISLDFELFWGLRDGHSLPALSGQVLGARKAIPQILGAFATHEIHATWATVGFLSFEARMHSIAAAPEARPRYRDMRLSPYPQLARIGPDERRDPFHFGRSLVELIAKTPHQEVATHTFSHYYCLEPGQDLTAFRADLDAAQRAAASLGLALKSIVFPRNQVCPAYFAALRDAGIEAYRGNPGSPLYAASGKSGNTLAKRAGRLADSYVNLSGTPRHSSCARPRVAQHPG